MTLIESAIKNDWQSLCRRFPPTRYQGSKRKLLPWIGRHVERLDFESVLDVFGGTGAVSYLFKSLGKEITYNDVLLSNQLMARGLIANDRCRLSSSGLTRLEQPVSAAGDDDFVARTFGGVYFTDAENAWIDRTVQNIGRMRDKLRQALAYFALFQACLIKRPYNLFHRKNLYMRTASVERSFGNKASWDRPFSAYLRRFAEQANDAVFEGDGISHVMGYEADQVPGEYDLIYVDPPYVTAQGVGLDYHHFYHFLEGLADYANWGDRIDYNTKHLRLQQRPNPWCHGRTNVEAFEQLFARFASSMIVVSYRSDGIPSIEQLVELLARCNRNVTVHRTDNYQYALSKNRQSCEVLLIAQ